VKKRWQSIQGMARGLEGDGNRLTAKRSQIVCTAMAGRKRRCWGSKDWTYWARSGDILY
jgi:hypothetical protein